jgi:hypothetical protein
MIRALFVEPCAQVGKVLRGIGDPVLRLAVGKTQGAVRFGFGDMKMAP